VRGCPRPSALAIRGATSGERDTVLVAGEEQVCDGAVPVGGRKAGRFGPVLPTLDAGAAPRYWVLEDWRGNMKCCARM
jgi:hypothetical protein